MVYRRKNFKSSLKIPGYITRSKAAEDYSFSESSLRRYEKKQYYLPELDRQTPLLVPYKFEKNREIYYKESQIKELYSLREILNKKTKFNNK